MSHATYRCPAPLAAGLAAAVFLPGLAWSQQTAPVLDGPGLSPLPLSGGGRSQEGARFNPAISVILDGNFYDDRNTGDFFDGAEHARGFVNPHDHDDHDHGETVPGFNLGHTEITFTASVDHYFDAVLTLALDGHGVEIEEAYGVTRSLPAGLQLKFGRFFSGIGYENSQHAHNWDFVDRSLPYLLIFGDHGLQEDGLQLNWMPRWNTYARFGAEVLHGRNAGMSNYEGGEDYDTGSASDMDGPRLWTLFAKAGPDLGPDHALQAGVFGGKSRLHQNLHGSRGEEGDAWFAGTDWVYRYDAGGAYGHGSLKLQAEYIYRERDLSVVGVRAGDEINHPLGERRRDQQDAFYVQGTYGVAPRWTAGLRYERAGMTNDPGQRSNLPADVDWAASERVTAALTWQATEFSRLRLQMSRSHLASDDAGGRDRYDQIYLQYQLALGAHGAHSF